MVLTLAGEMEEAREAGLEVERLSPRDPILWATTVVQALSHVLDHDPDAALEWVRKTEQLHRSTGYWVPAVSAAALSQSGRLDEAREAVAAARSALPKLSLSYLAEALPTRQPDGLRPYLDALRAAGLPE
jgi:adenylate cyclase